MTVPSYSTFIKAYPAYESTHTLDELRARDYTRLDKNRQVYLDYTGAGLYAESQVHAHHKLLEAHVFGNPHSSNPTSKAATQLVEQTRESILKFFNADPGEYLVIITSNASAALKLVGESYPFEKDGHFLLTFDNHNSVNGIREFAHHAGSQVNYIPVALPEMRVLEEQLEGGLDLARDGCHNLFAFPAQSNFSGVQHPLEWIERAHSRGWEVLLDAAAYAPTNRLDLGRWKPDYVPISFYKIFGYPTGVGALIARRESLAKLRRPWFAGGTITVVSVQGDRYFLAEGAAAFEDGTIDYLNIPALEIGLRHIELIGLEKVHTRVTCLTGWLLDNLKEMRHSNGETLVHIYGPTGTGQRGGSVTVNFFDQHNLPIDHRFIEESASLENISIRTGCFCNPGAGEIALGISSMELAACFSMPGHQQRLSYDDFRLCIDGKASGAVRISTGLVSNFEDVQAFLGFARGLLR
jgi:molybdenum cofactor sulfurtransferase